MFKRENLMYNGKVGANNIQMNVVLREINPDIESKLDRIEAS